MSDRWHMVKKPDWLREQLSKAAKYKDKDQRDAAELVSKFLAGEDINTPAVARALWTLGYLYAIKWD